MSLKKLLIIALAVGGLSTAIQLEAQARPHAHGPKIMKMLFKDVNLSADQKEALKDLRPSKEERESMRTKRTEKKSRAEWMQDFADGRLSRAEVLRTIEEKIKAKHAHKEEKISGLLDVLSTLDSDQKEQVLANLEMLGEKKEQKREKFAQKRAERKGKGKRGEKKMERMFEGITLDATQKARLGAVQDFQKERREDRIDHSGWKHEIMVSFLSGEQSMRSIIRMMDSKIDEHLSGRKQAASLWMDLIESLRAEQQDILFDNMADIKQAHEERREKRKKERGARE
jgi:hypothetical protein